MKLYPDAETFGIFVTNSILGAIWIEIKSL